MPIEKEQQPKLLKATAFGWMRRKELDQETYDVWEKPCGELYYAIVGGQPPMLQRG